VIQSTNFNDLLSISSIFFKNSFLDFFCLTLTYWAMSFVICLIFFYWVILISYLKLQGNRVNMGWLSFFFKLIFYSILSFAIKLLTLKHCYFFHLSLCKVILGAGWSSILASLPQISDVSSSIVVEVAYVAFCFFPLLSYLIFVLVLKNIKSTPRVCYT
jgi:hypothetical protein